MCRESASTSLAGGASGVSGSDAGVYSRVTNAGQMVGQTRRVKQLIDGDVERCGDVARQCIIISYNMTFNSHPSNFIIAREQVIKFKRNACTCIHRVA